MPGTNRRETVDTARQRAYWDALSADYAAYA